MKRIASLFASFALFAVLALAPLIALAQEVVPPSADEIQAFIAALGGLGGLGALGIVAVAVQGIALLLRSQLGDLTGRFRFVAITGLTLVGGIIALRTQGLEWPAVILHSTTLAALQVFLNQAWKQIFTSKGDR